MNLQFTPPNFLRLDEDRILVEQLRLLLRNVNNSLFTAALLCAVLLVFLSNDNDVFALRVWAAVLILEKIVATLHARRHLAAGITPENSRGLVRELLLFNFADGILWSSLVWITLGAGTTADNILVLSTVAALVGSSAPREAAIFPVFIVFVSTMFASTILKTIHLGDPTYTGIGMATLVYAFCLFLIARNSASDIKAGIQLRFKNLELVEQLQVKTEIAETARHEAEHANLAKSKFLAAASHDLRQPIHAQSLFLEVLARTELTKKQSALLANARASSEASGELLNELLDFSRIEAGVVEPQVQAFRLQPLLHKIENEHASQANAKNLVYRTRETEAAVLSDPMLVELILRNLISNAIRYTKHGGVLVTCRLRGDHVVLEVWDTGIGIAQEDRQEVFREFHQLGNPERDRHKGLGLGLAIVKGLADRLGHQLSLASIPQRGSVFRLALPVATGCAVEHASPTQSHPRILNARVLVIDDDSAVCEGMLHLLNDWGCECEAAESIEEALALVSLKTPDVIVSDYRLREQRTGVEAISAVRAALGNDIPALLITGDTAPDRLREAQASGIPLLHKPVSPGKLYRKLIELINLKTAVDCPI